MKCVFLGRSSLQTICPILIPSLTCLLTPSPSSSRLGYDSHYAVLPLNPRIHPKHFSKTNSIIRYCLTSGNVRISPKYASAKGVHQAGRIDFFIPIMKWGIEITQDGNRLLDHAARFTDCMAGVGRYDGLHPS